MKKALLLLGLAGLVYCTPSKEDFLERLMQKEPAEFQHILNDTAGFEVQIIYTQIDRDENNIPSFRSFYYHVDTTRYFYPASTVKFPLCLLALEKINELKMEGLDMHTPMFHDSVYTGQKHVVADTTSENGLPSVAHYIKKILTVSDNDAYNRLYEFMGQKAANERLHEKGYHVRFLHRLERALSPDQNRHTEAVRFLKDGKEIYQQPMLVNEDSIEAPVRVLKGKGYYKNDTILVKQPFDFTYKNFYSLIDQQHILRSVLFPESVDARSRFNLTQNDYRFLYQYLSQLPTETTFPPYFQDTAYHDATCKFLLYGSGPQPIPDDIRIFNKVGNAYGFLIDNAYIVNFYNGVEFMLSAVIHVNTDGIYNDGNYDYETIGYPFLKNLGRLIYDFELQRHRKNKPDLSKFKVTYDRARH